MRLLHVLVGRPLVIDSNLQKLLNPWQTQPSRPSLFISDSLTHRSARAYRSWRYCQEQILFVLQSKKYDLRWKLWRLLSHDSRDGCM